MSRDRSLTGLVGQAIVARPRLTHSLAQIAEEKVVEMRGQCVAAFKVGGKFGNVVTSSDISKIHRGWRIVAVNGQRLAAEEVPSALITAQKSVKYSLTFYLDPGADADRLEKERLRKEQLEKERLEKERLEKERLEQEHLEKERLEKERLEEERLEKERVEKERLEKERLDKELLEKERLDKERQQNLLEERLEKERLEEELKKARLETEAKVVRGAAERRLETSTGLPPRETVAEPQRALLAALVPAKATAPAKATGPCDKCDGPHATDNCPHFKKPRDDHKDAFENYQKEAKDTKSAQETETFSSRAARVVSQPGDGSCLFHSLNYGLGGSGAAALRAKLADFIAANPKAELAGNPICDWVLWDTGEDVQSYARSMRDGSRWGGAMELALCAQLRKVRIDIFERRSGGFARIASFGDGQPVRLLYGGRVHYDALEVSCT
ncbi:unnamed protein product [Effrenium voratum]|nr:unnamed protein product [Effrenium voratum]